MNFTVDGFYQALAERWRQVLNPNPCSAPQDPNEVPRLTTLAKEALRR